MAKKNQSSNISRTVLDLCRGGMTVWESEQYKPRRNYSLPHENLSWEDYEEIANWFAYSMAQSHLVSSEIDVLLPRSAVCLHLLELPCTDDVHLKGMIQIQVESLYGERVDSIAFDYAPLQWPAEPDGKRFVLLATIPRAYLESIKRLCHGAGLNLKRTLIRDLMVTRSFLETSSRINFFVWLDDHSRTIGIAIGDQVIQTISIPMTSQLPVAEVFRGYERRLLQSLPIGFREFDVGQRLAFVTVSDPVQQQLASSWADSIGLEKQRDSSPVELCQASIALASNSTHVVDFCNTYQTKPTRNLRRPAMMFATLALLGIGALFVYRYMSRAAGELQLANLQTQIHELQSELDSLSDPVEQFELAKQWRNSQVNWGHELTLISKQSSTAKNAYLYRLQMDSFDGERLPVIRMDGRATSVPEAMKWNRQLSKLNDRYSIQPQSLDSGVTDPDYPTQFRVEAQLNHTEMEAEDPLASRVTGGRNRLESETEHMQVIEKEELAL